MELYGVLKTSAKISAPEQNPGKIPHCLIIRRLGPSGRYYAMRIGSQLEMEVERNWKYAHCFTTTIQEQSFQYNIGND